MNFRVNVILLLTHTLSKYCQWMRHSIHMANEDIGCFAITCDICLIEFLQP